MKVNIEIDCTPQESRAFFGMPDVTPLHEAWLDRMTSMLREEPNPVDLTAMARAWAPGVAESFEQWRQMVIAAMPKPPQ